MAAAVSMGPTPPQEDLSFQLAVRVTPAPPVSQAEPARDGGNSTGDERRQEPRDLLSDRLAALARREQAKASSDVDTGSETAEAAPEPREAPQPFAYSPPAAGTSAAGATEQAAPPAEVAVPAADVPRQPQAEPIVPKSLAVEPKEPVNDIKTIADLNLEEALRPRKLFPLSGPADAYQAADRVDQGPAPKLLA